MKIIITCFFVLVLASNPVFSEVSKLLLSKDENYKLVKLFNFTEIYQSNGVKFNKKTIIINFKECSQKEIFLRVKYKETNQHSNKFSNIIKIIPAQQDLYLNLFRTKVINKNIASKLFYTGKKLPLHDDIIFDYLEVHQEDLNCINSISPITTNFIGHYKKIIKFKKTVNLQKLNIKNANLDLIYLNNKVLHKDNILEGNFFSSIKTFQDNENLNSDSYLFQFFYKKIILGYFFEDLYRIKLPKNVNFYVDCDVYAGSLTFLRLREEDKKILNFEKCSSKHIILLNSNIDNSILIVTFANSAFNYRQANFIIKFYSYD